MNTQIEKLQKKIIDFRNERNWEQFHKIKDLLIGLSSEAAELSELFLWKNSAEIESIDKKRISEEVADIFIFLIYICENTGVDLAVAVEEKLKANGQKYPIEKCYGSNKKYNQL